MVTSIFRAYDVRGIYPSEINKENAYRIGFATTKFLQNKEPEKRLRIVVGEDARMASPPVRGAVIDAVTKAGADVIYIGPCTTPLFYFSVIKLGADGGLMATASHNPAEYGGLKIVGREARPISSENGLKEIEQLSYVLPDPAKEPGKIEEADLTAQYVDFVIKSSAPDPSKLKKLKIVVDAGNGMTSLVLKPLFEKLGMDYIPMYFEVDCSFPNHSPDVSKPEALAGLRNKVPEVKADLGIAFDGDGDRVFFVDKKGDVVKPDYILALLYKNSGNVFRKPKVVYDVRASRSVKELFGSRGIKAKPGHSFIKLIMREYNAGLGGELSGHFFFREAGCVESSLLAMMKILKIMSVSGKSLSSLVVPFRKYFHSGEINLEVADREGTIALLRERYKDAQLNFMDGITAEYPDWWFNVRPSNTEPILRLVVEAGTKEMMEAKVSELKEEIIKNRQ